MKFAIGIVVFGLYALLSGLAFRSSLGSWSLGHSDHGVGWSVIGSHRRIAGLGALVGSWLHTKPSTD